MGVQDTAAWVRHRVFQNSMLYLRLKVVVEVLVIRNRAGIVKDACIKLVSHVNPRKALHPGKVCNLLVTVVARQAQSEHAGIIACRLDKRSWTSRPFHRNVNGLMLQLSRRICGSDHTADTPPTVRHHAE